MTTTYTASSIYEGIVEFPPVTKTPIKDDNDKLIGYLCSIEIDEVREYNQHYLMVHCGWDKAKSIIIKHGPNGCGKCFGAWVELI